MEMMYEGRKVQVLELRELSATIIDGEESKTVNRAKLKEIKRPKPTDVQIALRDDPAILALIWEQYQNRGRLLISCQGSRVDHLANEISQITSLSEIDAVDYISAASEKTHAMKFYVMLPASADDEFYKRVSNFFGARTTLASTREVQYNSRSLAEWLMKEHEVLPERRT